MEQQQNMPMPKIPIPKRSCMITLMFEVKDDTQAYNINGAITELVKDIDPKRYTFQIDER